MLGFKFLVGAVRISRHDAIPCPGSLPVSWVIRVHDRYDWRDRCRRLDDSSLPTRRIRAFRRNPFHATRKECSLSLGIDVRFRWNARHSTSLERRDRKTRKLTQKLWSLCSGILIAFSRKPGCFGPEHAASATVAFLI